MNNITKTSANAKTTAAKRPTASQLEQAEMERTAKRDKRIRIMQGIAQGAMILALALIGFTGSWQHLRDLGVLAGGSASVWYGTANLTPISVDLMLIIASVQLRRKGISDVSRLIARLCSLSGLLLSIAGNVLVAWLHLPADANGLRIGYTLVWAAVPVLSLLGAVEMLTHTRKDRPTVSKAVGSKAKSANASAPASQRSSRSAAQRAAEATA